MVRKPCTIEGDFIHSRSLRFFSNTFADYLSRSHIATLAGCTNFFAHVSLYRRGCCQHPSAITGNNSCINMQIGTVHR